MWQGIVWEIQEAVAHVFQYCNFSIALQNTGGFSKSVFPRERSAENAWSAQIGKLPRGKKVEFKMQKIWMKIVPFDILPSYIRPLDILSSDIRPFDIRPFCLPSSNSFECLNIKKFFSEMSVLLSTNKNSIISAT